MKQETVMLAHTYKEGKHLCSGAYMSEKLDGMRCIWIPWTRGMKKKDVPFANTDKDERLLEEEICTGLWSRYFNCVDAPDWWLEEMPNLILDGELYSDVFRQDLMSVIKRKKANRASDESWSKINFYAFSLPHYTTLFKDRHVYNQQIDKVITALDWCKGFIYDLAYHSKNPLNFRQEVFLLEKHCSGRAIPHKQVKLPYKEEDAKKIVFEELERVSSAGGEGLMVRHDLSVWDTVRSHDLIKFKKLDDDEATIIGYTSGKITDKESRNHGRIGALRVRNTSGTEFTISGMRDAERGAGDHTDWCLANPDSILPSTFDSEFWPLGTQITYQYRGLSKDKVPNEARIWRKYEAN